MKKLLICSPSHAVHGGVETIIGDLCLQLPTWGWHAVLGLGKGARFNDIVKYRAAHPDVPMIEIDGVRGTRQARQEGLLEAIDTFRPDVVLIARVFDAYSVIGALKRRRSSPRLAVTIQVYEPHYLFDARLYREHIDLCVTSGTLLRRAAIEWAGLPEERVVSIPGGVRKPEVPVSPRGSREVLRLGYVGRLDPGQKRIRDLVAFLEILQRENVSYRLEVVGTGAAESELRERLAELVKVGRVTFRGWLSREELYHDVYPELDCLVHFADTEGVTIAPREAMAHGVVPVISRFVGRAVEGQFVHESNALTFPVGDVAAAAACVQRLFDEPGLLWRLSARAMRSQEGGYSFEETTRAWVEALERCLMQPVRTGKLPQVSFGADGRLARMGTPPWLAQRIRDLLGRRHQHADAGSEWPTGSGLLTLEASDSLRRFAEDLESTRAEAAILG